MAHPRSALFLVSMSLGFLLAGLATAQAGDDLDIACMFEDNEDGIVIDGSSEEVVCYDMDLVNECMVYHDGETSCFNEDNEADLVVDPKTATMKANIAGARKLKRLMRKDKMLQRR